MVIPSQSPRRGRTLDLASLVRSAALQPVWSSGQLGSMSTGSTLGKSDNSLQDSRPSCQDAAVVPAQRRPSRDDECHGPRRSAGGSRGRRERSSTCRATHLRRRSARKIAEPTRNAETRHMEPGAAQAARTPARFCCCWFVVCDPRLCSKTPNMPRRRLLPLVELPFRSGRKGTTPVPYRHLLSLQQRGVLPRVQGFASRMKPRAKRLPKRVAASRSSRSFRRRAHYRSTRSARQMASAARSKQSNRGLDLELDLTASLSSRSRQIPRNRMTSRRTVRPRTMDPSEAEDLCLWWLFRTVARGASS